MSGGPLDAMLYEWQSSYYPRDAYTEEARILERRRRVGLGQFIIQRDAPGGSKQFKAFDNVDAVYEFLISQIREKRTFYETVFDVHPKQKPYFDVDIVPTESDPMDHAEILERLLTEIKRVVGPDLDLVEDISVYSSHATNGTKYSYHVVLNGYHVHGNIEAHNFAKAIRDGMVAMTPGTSTPEAQFIIQSIDLVVYKKLQQFRMLGCTKLGRDRHKTVVLEYSAAGRTRIRPILQAKEEFLRSLLSHVPEESKYLDPKIYTRPREITMIANQAICLDDADDLLRALCSRARESAYNAVTGVHGESLWFKDAQTIVAHCVDAGHLTSELFARCQAGNGDLITLRAPPAGGYECIACDRRHENENPYLTLREDWYTDVGVPPLYPRVVAIIYHCRRDPTTTVRICSMRGGGSGGVSAFTCLEEPRDPRRGEKQVRAITEETAAVDM